MSQPTAKIPVSYQEMKERLNNSTNEQIGELVRKIGEGAGRGKGIDPFKDPRNRLTIPSAIRTYWIDWVLRNFNEGEIIANK